MWLYHRLIERMKRRKHQVVCHRCGLLRQKTLIACPHCGGLTDDEVSQLVKQRAKWRLGLGRTMTIAAAVIFMLMLLMNSS